MARFNFVPTFLRVYFDRFVKLFTNPTSIYFAVLLAIQLIVVFSVALCIPLLVRQLLLPSSVQHEIPLNLVFSPCDADLHGVCSYPTAQVDVQKFAVFSPSVTYALSVRLVFAPVDVNSKIGLFQNQLSLIDSNGDRLKQWNKSAYIKEPSIFIKIVWLMFFPLYFLGYFSDQYTLEIFFTDDYLVSPERLPTTLLYALQDKFAQVDSAFLLINARFGLIRHILYYWPILTYWIMFSVTLSVCLCVLLLYWGHLGYSVYSAKEDASNPETEQMSDEAKSKPGKDNRITSRKTKPSPPPDEYIPPNVNEVPECVTSLPGIPGMDFGPTATDTQTKSGDTVTELSGDPQTKLADTVTTDAIGLRQRKK